MSRPVGPVNPAEHEQRKAAAKNSPWRRGPHCPTKRAQASHARYVKNGRAKK